MTKPDGTRGQNEVDAKRDSRGLPDDINSDRSGLAEADVIGSQADVLSPTGTRIDDEMLDTQQDLIRQGTPQVSAAVTPGPDPRN